MIIRAPTYIRPERVESNLMFSTEITGVFLPPMGKMSIRRDENLIMF